METAARRVSHWENENTKGLALCSQGIFEDYIEEAQKLRDRQAQYEASLPTDPAEIIAAAKSALQPDCGDYPEGLEEIRHLSTALTVLARHGDFDTHSPERDAAVYMSDRIERAVRRVVSQLDRVADVLGTPGRLEREATGRRLELERQFLDVFRQLDKADQLMLSEALKNNATPEEIEALIEEIKQRRAACKVEKPEEGGED